VRDRRDVLAVVGCGKCTNFAFRTSSTNIDRDHHFVCIKRAGAYNGS
jgi:hypothetical protein